MHQVQRSHICLALEIQLNIFSALARDLYSTDLISLTDLRRRFLVKDIFEHDAFRILPLTLVLQELLSCFISTYQRRQIKYEYWASNKEIYPYCMAMLAGYDFVENVRNTSKDQILHWALRSDDREQSFCNYYIGPTLGTAFGAFCDIGPYLIGSSLSPTNKDLVLLVSGAYNIQQNLNLLFSSTNSVRVVDLDTEAITLELLLDYYLSGGNTGLINDMSHDLYSGFLIESINYNLCRDSRDLSTQLSAIYLLEKAASIGCRNLTLQASSISQLKVRIFIEHCKHMKLILLTTRDDLWVGGGQPWRNTNVQTIRRIIKQLLRQGYAVIRFNLVAEPIPIKHDFFLDFASGEFGFPDQLVAASSCALNIGAMTGATDIARQLYAKPTIYIEASNLYLYGLRGWTSVISKRLTIADPSLWTSRSHEQRLDFLLKDSWTYDNCEKYGLSLEPRTSSEILASLYQAMCALEKRQTLPTQLYYCNSNNATMEYPNIPVCDETGRMLQNLINVGKY